MSKKAENEKQDNVQKVDTETGEPAVAAEVAEEATPEEAKAQNEPIAVLQKERDDMLALAQRVQADFDNYRRRTACAQVEAVQEGVAKAMEAMLPVADNLDRALSLTEGVEASFVEGVEMVRKQLLGVFAQLGVEEIPAEGESFDPNLHNAVMQCPPAQGQECGMVASVMLKGYRLGGKVLRHSMVIVTQ